ncbi:DNA primase [Klebsiella pneumoniae]|uniref:DNA primase n=1 Tax=Klebsiella pneumoniae TaxID=573 RepID=A0A3S4GYY5_KLEPN|nr:DNA primase [Klebsiella pneumoniae]
MWDDIADKDIAEQTFTDSLNHMFDSLLELRQEELIARDRTHGLSSEERRELWTISQELAKKINDRQYPSRCIKAVRKRRTT